MINLDEPVVMGILNLTPDSFFDGGKYKGDKEILCQVEKMLKEGAAIIDIGAFSSRPGAAEISEDQELERLLPTLELIQSEFKSITISIDTYRSTVANEAIKAGASIINDISGGQLDSQMFEIIAKHNATYILMHMQGTPNTMQNNPSYKNVVKEVKAFFEQQISKLNTLNCTSIILDPGFGFGKTVDHNYQLLKYLNEFNSLSYPVLAGLSRKSMINKVLGTQPSEALNGTSVLNTIALLNGAKILRVHDVKQAKECINLVSKLNEQQ